MRFLVTGTAGFIGFHVARLLLEAGEQVTGIDGLTPYYDVSLKKQRHSILSRYPEFRVHEFMLEDWNSLEAAYVAAGPEVVIHLAAQAGVRYSLENPRAYIDTNLVGLFNLLELIRRVPPRHFLLASTSSVYGGDTEMPFKEDASTDHPLSLYAATKKAGEVIVHSYSHLWSIPSTAFRFFSIYGPWGRPDMALFKFTRAIINDEPIDLYNSGRMTRDFTYIDDLAKAVLLLAERPPSLAKSPNTSLPSGVSPCAPFQIVNIGNGSPVNLLEFVEAIEQSLGRKARRNHMPMQAGDVPATLASTDLLFRLTGFRPSTPITLGVRRFVEWYTEYYQR